MLDLDEALHTLEGEPIVPSEPRGRNVLLIILEGVSGGYLPRLRARHGAESPIEMPELDRSAGSGRTGRGACGAQEG